jgi:predicted metal-dependent peptidase
MTRTPGARGDEKGLPLDAANRLLALAWQPASHAEMAAVLAPHLASRSTDEARALCEAWMPRPRAATDPELLALPNGAPVPPPATPWAREDSLIPGVDLPVAAILEAAWEVVRADVDGTSPLVPAGAAFTRLRATAGVRVPPNVQERLVARWVDGRALACLRAAHPRSAPDGTLTLREAKVLLDRVRTGDAHAAWRHLVACGWEPRRAAADLAGYNPRTGRLPNGQWLPDDLVPKGDHAASPLDADVVHEVLELLKTSPAKAIKRVRDAAHVPAERARAILDELVLHDRGDHGGDGARPRPSEPRGVAHEAADGRTEARRAIDQAVHALLGDRPFHWALLARTRFVEEPGLGTMSVGLTATGEITLFFDPAYTLALTEEQRMGLLVHEMHHVMFGHLEGPPGGAGGTGSEDEQAAWELACEATANEYVPYDLPDPITIERLGLPPHESTLARYERLRRKKKLLTEHGSKVKPTKDVVRGALAPRARSISDRAPGTTSPRGALLSASERVGDEVDLPTRDMLRVAGLAAVHEERLFPAGTASLPWEALVRVFVRGLSLRQPTRTYPSRRFPERLGVYPGRRARRETPVVLAVLDTSASMTHEELTHVAEELSGLAALAGTRVRVCCVQCDTAIRARTWLRATGGAALDTVRGRGGTDLRVPFAAAELRRVRPDLIVVFTDGHGPAPDRAPPDVAVLWVLTGDAPRAPARFGRVVNMRRAKSTGGSAKLAATPTSTNQGAGNVPKLPS